MDEELFCPICGEFAPEQIWGEHRCSPEALRKINKRYEKALQQEDSLETPESNPPYGEQLDDGFAFSNPYGDDN